jgi:hypothetical protein
MNLAAMIAKQKAAQSGGTNNESKSEAGSGVLPAAGGDSVAASPVSGGGKLKFGIKKKGEDNVQPKPAQPATPAPVPTGKPAVDRVADATPAKLTLDDIADTTVEGVTTNSERGEFAFADEIAATAPTRELPPELTAGMADFVKQLDSIYEVIHDPELFGQMIRTIMLELKENPDYTQVLADQDVHTMIRGLRSSMGLAKIKKAEKSTKARGPKKSTASTQVMSTADEMFNSEDW